MFETQRAPPRIYEIEDYTEVVAEATPVSELDLQLAAAVESVRCEADTNSSLDFTDCLFRWENSEEEVRAYCILLSRNPCFSLVQSPPPIIFTVDNGVRPFVVRALVAAHSGAASAEIVMREGEEGPEHWSPSERAFAVQHFGWLLGPTGSEGAGHRTWRLAAGTSGLAPISQHVAECFARVLYTDAFIVDPNGQWEVPVHRCVLASGLGGEGFLRSFFLRWSRPSSDDICRLQSEVSSERAVRLVLRMNFYGSREDLPSDPLVLAEAFRLAHLWDLKWLCSRIRERIHILSMNMHNGAEFVMEMVIQMFAAGWQDMDSVLYESMCVAVIKQLPKLPAEARSRLRSTCPESLMQDLEACSKLFSVTGYAFLDPGELLCAWCEDLTSQIHRVYEDWDTRWHFLGLQLRKLNASAMQRPNGGPAGITISAQSKRIPPDLWALYARLEADWPRVTDRVWKLDLQWDKLARLFPSSAEKVKAKKVEAYSKLPRLSRPVRLWEAR